MTRKDEYRLVLASDVLERDGLGLELYNAEGTCIAEVFRDDTTGGIAFTVFHASTMPLDVVEWYLQEARNSLLTD